MRVFKKDLMKKNIKKDQSLKSYLNKRLLIIAMIALAIVGHFWISSEYRDFRQNAKTLRENFIEAQRAKMILEVTNAVNYIKYNQNQIENRLQENIKERVYEAYSIALNIYYVHKDIKSSIEIGNLIKDALRPVRFNNGRGYYFAVSMNGVEKLYPVAPQFEEQNLLSLQDAKGNYVIKDEIAIIKEKGEGFVRDYWRKPTGSDEMIYPKITFVKYFEPLDWYIGTGEYLDDLKKDIQQESVKRLGQIRFDKEGYIFVNTYEGDAIIKNGNIVEENDSMWEVTDTNGNKVIQLAREAVENPTGGFIEYFWPKMGSEVQEEKISFVLGFPEWQWMIGAGFYANDIEPEVNLLKLKLEQNVQNNIIKIGIILISINVIVLIIGRLSYHKVMKNLGVFLTFFESAAEDSKAIKIEKFNVKEFSTIAEAANVMIKKRNEIEQERNENRRRLDLIYKILRHDLTNDFAVMRSAIRLYIKNNDKEMLTEMEKRVQKGLNTIDIVRKQESLMKNHSSLHSINLKKVLESIKEQYSQIVIEIKGDAIVFADEVLHSVFDNLISNAIIHGNSTKIDINIKGIDEICQITIADNGVFIPEEVKARIFEEGFNYGKSGHTGIGLYIVNKTIERYGGTISVKNNDPVGTLFVLKLRIA